MGVKQRSNYFRTHFANEYKVNPDYTQTLTDTVQSSGGLMLRCCVEFPGKEVGHATLPAHQAQCLYNWVTAKPTLNAIFAFGLFP